MMVFFFTFKEIKFMMTTALFSSVLAENIQSPRCVIDATLDRSSYMPIDLSEANCDLKEFDVSSSRAWQEYISSRLSAQGKRVAYGGYLERRSIYSRSAYFNTEVSETERNIHLGIDLWVEAGTKVLAAFDGEIHSFKDNRNYGDYGPTLILKHTINSVPFYTLYGHLSRESLRDLKEGTVVKQGQQIAVLGDASVNGDYAPHLHFQVIRDLQGNVGDYPGVSSLRDLEFYKKNCPDPNIILGL